MTAHASITPATITATAGRLDLDGERYTVKFTRGPRASALRALDDRHQLAAQLWWNTTTAVCHVWVRADRRRHRLATALLSLAREIEPSVRIAALRTPDGKAWARWLGE